MTDFEQWIHALSFVAIEKLCPESGVWLFIVWFTEEGSQHGLRSAQSRTTQTEAEKAGGFYLSPIAFWILAIFGVLKIILGIYDASQHGKPRGNHNGSLSSIEALIGVLLLLLAFEVF